MSIISVEQLGKRYSLGEGAPPNDTLRDAVSSFFKRYRHLSGSSKQSYFWALREISFAVAEGEVLGIIGRNGAGKSTLLKVLSQITEPTEGRAVMRGRVSSLLEVGSGFHSELTGRENIFLNGSILGMAQAEIKRKFDEIVDFAGIEHFLDTPVKRYSSGMYMRLAFAVAAHLEPEILIVDEVLAVGDMGFQKKCLGKMQDVASCGRTVIFVSHNMAAVQNLCDRAICIDHGKLIDDGPVERVVEEYSSSVSQVQSTTLASRHDRKGSGRVLFADYALYEDGKKCDTLHCGADVKIDLFYKTAQEFEAKDALFDIAIRQYNGSLITRARSTYSEITGFRFKKAGVISCKIPRLPLAPGTYSVNLILKISGNYSDYIQDAFTIEVAYGQYYSKNVNLNAGNIVLIDQTWEY